MWPDEPALRNTQTHMYKPTKRRLLQPPWLAVGGAGLSAGLPCEHVPAKTVVPKGKGLRSFATGPAQEQEGALFDGRERAVLSSLLCSDRRKLCHSCFGVFGSPLRFVGSQIRGCQYRPPRLCLDCDSNQAERKVHNHPIIKPLHSQGGGLL